MAGRADIALPNSNQTTWRSAPRLPGLAATTVILAVAVLLGHWVHRALPEANHSSIFLVAVLVSAVGFGFWAGLIAAALAFLSYNFFFVAPIHTFTVARAEDMLALSMFLLVATMTGFLAGRMREEAEAARHRAAMLEALSSFSTDLSEASTGADIEETMLRHLASVSGSDAALLRAIDDKIALARAEPADVALTASDFQSADRALRYGSSQPATAPGWEGSRFSFHPIVATDGPRDVLGIGRRDSGQRFAAEVEQAIASILRQGGVAIERMAMARSASEAREQAEREALRSALLSSLSHDLRTPLATILGSVTSLRQLGDTLPPEARADLLLAIEEETGRLARYVSNLLHMTRLRSGLDMRLDWIDPVDAAQAAIRRMRSFYPDRAIVFEAIDAPALIHTDAALLEQALCNPIDNALKFSPPDTPVRVRAERFGATLTISVTDQGEGMPDAERARVFQAFFGGGGTSAAGGGLGLAICKGIVQALGGAIRAESPVADGRGTAILVDLPIAEPEPR